MKEKYLDSEAILGELERKIRVTLDILSTQEVLERAPTFSYYECLAWRIGACNEIIDEIHEGKYNANRVVPCDEAQ